MISQIIENSIIGSIITDIEDNEIDILKTILKCSLKNGISLKIDVLLINQSALEIGILHTTFRTGTIPKLNIGWKFAVEIISVIITAIANETAIMTNHTTSKGSENTTIITIIIIMVNHIIPEDWMICKDTASDIQCSVEIPKLHIIQSQGTILAHKGGMIIVIVIISSNTDDSTITVNCNWTKAYIQ